MGTSVSQTPWFVPLVNSWLRPCLAPLVISVSDDIEMYYLHGVVDPLVHILGPVLVARTAELYREHAAVEVQLAGGLRLARDRQDRTARSVGGHQHGRAAGRRRRDDARRQAVNGRLDGGQGGRVGDVGGSRCQNAQLLEQLFVVDGRLRLACDLVHRLNCLYSQWAVCK